jgi:hypothetical protein
MRILDFSDGFTSATEPTSSTIPADQVIVTPTGNLSSTETQAALEELQGDIDILNTNLGANSTNVDIATSNSASTIDIGTGSGANVINLGGANSTVNFTGSVNNHNVTNLNVTDKLITINDGGAAASGGAAGIEVEENGSSAGYIKTAADRLSWEFKVPATDGIAKLTTGSGITDDIVLRQATQTLTNKTLTSPTVNTPTTDILTFDDQSSTPSNPSSGNYKLYFKTDGKIYKLDSSGTEAEVGASSFSAITFVSKTADYTLTSSDSGITGSASGASFTLTLPSPASNVGKVYRIIRTDQTLGNSITVTGTGLSTKLMTQNESIEVSNDGTNWMVLQRNIPQTWTSYTPTFGSLGTVTNINMRWRRDGSDILIKGWWTNGTTTTGNATFLLPSGLTIQSNFLNASAEIYVLGHWFHLAGTAYISNLDASFGVVTNAYNVTDRVYLEARQATNGFLGDHASTWTSSGNEITVDCRIPITDWES